MTSELAPAVPQLRRRGAPASRDALVVVEHGGRRFDSTEAMARCFLNQAQHVIDAGLTELVPLLHSHGVELLVISRRTPFTVSLKSE